MNIRDRFYCNHSTMLALFALVAMAPLSVMATDQPANCSTGKTSPTTITFDNQSSSAITLHWVNERCEEIAYGTLQPQAKVSKQTYEKHTWRIRGATSQWLLREVAATTPPVSVRVSELTNLLPRVSHDREDDVPDYYQIKVLYALPSDAKDKDRELDTNGEITRSIAAVQYWFSQQTGGRRLRFDTYEGALDIAFVHLDRSEKQFRDFGVYIRDRIEEDLTLKYRFDHPRKIYAVYYDGAADDCGSGPWPPKLFGTVAAIYLRASCDDRLAKSVAEPSMREFSVAHEILHTLGFVASCAPNHTRAGHVSDSPKDLMYAGPEAWKPSILDVGRNDYFEHGNLWCEDLARSAFLDPLPDNAEPPPGWTRPGHFRFRPTP